MRDNTEELIIEACYAVIKLKSAICVLLDEIRTGNRPLESDDEFFNRLIKRLTEELDGC